MSSKVSVPVIGCDNIADSNRTQRYFWLTSGTTHFDQPSQRQAKVAKLAGLSPEGLLAAQIRELPDVADAKIASGCIVVIKEEAADWESVTARVYRAITAHFVPPRHTRLRRQLTLALAG